MKSVFSNCRIFLCLFILYAVSSCSKYLSVYGNEKVPKKVCINIMGDTISNGHLTLIDDSGRDAYTFWARPGQKIKWVIKVDKFHLSNVIEKISSRFGTNAIFEYPPRKQHLAANWVATVKDTGAIHPNLAIDSGAIYWEYKIAWHLRDTVIHTFDPRIQIRI